MKKYFLGILLMIFIVPSVAFASWWNPFSWNIFHWFDKSQKTETVQIDTTLEIASTTPESTATTTVTTRNDTTIKEEKVEQDAFFDKQKKDQLDIKQPSATVPSQPISVQQQCVEDIWGCSDWLVCTSSGSQIRSCTKTFECSSIVTQSPITSQPCIPPTPSCQSDIWECGDWKPCSASGNQTRICSKTFECPSVYTPPVSMQSCTPPTNTKADVYSDAECKAQKESLLNEVESTYKKWWSDFQIAKVGDENGLGSELDYCDSNLACDQALSDLNVRWQEKANIFMRAYQDKLTKCEPENRKFSDISTIISSSY